MEIKTKGGKVKRISNNILAIVGIFLTIFSMVCNIIVYHETSDLLPIGYASSAQSTISLNITGNAPNVTILYPNNCEILNGTITMNASVDDAEGANSITNNSFYYSNISGSSSWYYINRDFYDGEVYYNSSWNTSTASEGVFFKIRGIAYDLTGLSGQGDSDSYFAVNNVDQEPDWTKFKYPSSTNLTALADPINLGEWTAITDLRLANQYGMINYTGQATYVDGANLSKHFNITYAKIEIDNSELPCITNSIYLHFYSVSMTDPIIMRDGAICSAGVCTLVSNDGADLVYRVIGYASYEVTDSAVLDIWDVTDEGKYNGNQTRYIREQTEFYANLTSDGTPLNASYISCWIWFNMSPDDFEHEEMNYSSISTLYEYNRPFKIPGTYQWNVTCNSTLSELFVFKANDTVNITNRPPTLLYTLPNITMEEDRIMQYVDLDDYFNEPDGNTMTYNVSEVSNIAITFDLSHFVYLAPDENWFGNRSFTLTAIDQYGLSTDSNLIHVTVTDVAEDTGDDSGEGSGGAGGGGGGYTETEYIESPECSDDWECSPWSACEYKWPDMGADKINEHEGIRTRVCIDTNSCNYWWKKPNESMNCEYEPTCSDLIKNQGEEKVDCGGPNCPICPTCNDTIQNQGEQGVDCGGPCNACSTCFDGIKNQDEEGVDCGGSCKSCVILEGPIRFDLFMTILLIIMMSTLMFTTYIFARPYIVKISMKILELKARLAKERLPTKTLLDLEYEVLAQLDNLTSQIDKGNLDLILTQFHTIFRRFLREALMIDYEFTYEELLEYVKKQRLPGLLRIALNNFVAEIIELQYGKKKLSKESLKKEIVNAKELVDLIIKHVPKQESVKDAKKLADTKTEMIKLYRMIVDVKKSLAKGEIKKAGKVFLDINNIYETLSEENQKELKRQLSRLRRQIRKGSKKR